MQSISRWLLTLIQGAQRYYKSIVISIVTILIFVGITYLLIIQQSYPAWTGITTKTAWDALDLFIIPFILAVIAYLFSRRQKQIEFEIAQKERENDRRIAQDRDQEETIRKYFDDIIDLLLNHNLRTAQEESEVYSIAQALTFSTLRRLDGKRKGDLLLFLIYNNLIRDKYREVSRRPRRIKGFRVKESPMTLHSANLEGIHLRDTVLQGLHLRRTILRNANFRRTELNRVFFSKADLSNADLTMARIYNTEFFACSLYKADFTHARLSKVSFSNSLIIGANFENASFDEVDFKGVQYDNTTIWPKGFTQPFREEVPEDDPDVFLFNTQQLDDMYLKNSDQAWMNAESEYKKLKSLKGRSDESL
jgi:uncharacterized protein YjbI with pentapeptide repeats